MTLPDWTKSLVPVGMDDAAMLLGVSRRFLVDKLKSHQFYERRGSKKVFYPEHIALLREALSCQTLNLKAETGSGMPLAQSPESAYESLGTRDKQVAEQIRAQYEARLWKSHTYGEEAVRLFEEAATSYMQQGGEGASLRRLSNISKAAPLAR